VDPFAPSFASDISAVLARETAAFWPTVRALMPDLDDELALRNAWAVAVAQPLWVAVLHRSVHVAAAPPMRALADRLLTVSASVVAQDPVALAVSRPSPTGLPPDLLHAQILMPGMRLRYALAHRLLLGEDVAEMVSAAQETKGASAYLRCRELLRLLREAEARGLRIRPCRPTVFLMLPAPHQALVLSSTALVGAMLAPALARHPALSEWVAARVRQRDHAHEAASLILKALAARDFPRAEQALRDVPANVLTRLVCREVMAASGDGADKDPALTVQATAGGLTVAANPPRGSLGRRTWQPLSDQARRHLNALMPSIQVPAFWQLGAKAVARALIDRALPAADLAPLERRLLAAAWSRADHHALIAGDLPELVPAASGVWAQLSPDQIAALLGRRNDAAELMQRRLSAGMTADEMLELLARHPGPWMQTRIEHVLGGPGSPKGFAARIVRHVGTSTWQQAGGWVLHGKSADVQLLVFAYDTQVLPVDPSAFTDAVVDWALAAVSDARPGRPGTKSEQARQARIATAAALAGRFAQVLQGLASRAPAQWLEELIPQLQSLPALEALQRSGPPVLAPHVLQARARLAQGPQQQLDLLVEAARARLPIPWCEAWRAAALEADAGGDGHLRRAVLVLALRRQAKRLHRLAGRLDAEQMRAALAHAAQLLRGTPGRDSAFLELAAHVGLAETPALAAALAACDHAAPPGSRVDAAYTRWTLPKRSGGVRTISAPAPALKRAQRALLRSLLDPLGVHPCAHGFAKGRSILGNASVHVAREIVVNGDVSNCFPSVRWPLVLGALRRDLGDSLSAGAIGLLVDLCTAEGGLPTGAPTSPALLNRVLLRTDEILFEQAQRRGCLYSRYADDLTFSGDHRAVEMLGVARGVLSRIGLSLDPAKTNIFRQGRRQMCTGLVVNEQVSVPRRLRRRLRAAVHQAAQGRGSHWHGQPQTTGSLMGRLAFLGMVHPEEAARLRKALREAPVGHVPGAADGQEPST
jgi:hypothetical protein